MLVDDVVVVVKAGNGGDGAVSFRRNAQTAKGGPDGGNGGKGGDIYAKGVTDITALQEFQYKKSVKAEDGIKGDRNNLFGRKGKDLTIKVPIGTRITDIDSGWRTDIDSEKTVLIARGGHGGRGNNEFKSATNQSPRIAEEGKKGEERHLKFELRLIADIGLIGLPNAGKSSLLEAITNAKPKIADYPFTTLEPNLGVLNGRVIADIPGLIQGAARGKGLGIKFLKHIEKTRLLVHCLDVLSGNLLKDYNTVRTELKQYSDDLAKKEEIILLTKTDLVDEVMISEKKAELAVVKKPMYTCSIYSEKDLLAITKLLT